VAAALRLRAPAKVNLALQVGPRRADGYHEVRTVLQALALHDRVDIEPAAALEVSCDDPAAGDGPANLAWRAADALRRAAGGTAGARIRVRKRIPVRAGLGGGSADAAAALLGCNALWGLAWTRPALAELAAALGSDVPFFLLGGTAWAEGRGERVEPLPALPALPAVVCHPGPGVSTAEAYAALDALGDWPAVDAAGLAAALRRGPGEAALAQGLGNAFEAAVLPARPDIAALRARLLAAGARAALLCGSGAAIWALAPSAAWARAQAGALRRDGLWAAATRFCAPAPGIPGAEGWI